MDPLPIIPDRLRKDQHDTASTLRKTFQDVLHTSVVPPNLLENAKQLMTTHPTSLADKNDYFINFPTLDDAEEMTLSQNAFFITKEHISSQESNLKIKKNLNIPNLTCDYDPLVLEKFPLITKADLDVPEVKKAVDFQYNKSSKPAKYKEKKTETTYITLSKRRQSQKKVKHKIEKHFEVIPDTVVFSNYKVNKIYKKHIVIKNISTKTYKVNIKQMPKTGKFTVQKVTSYKKLAPGINLIFVVFFQTDIMLDFQDSVLFHSQYGDVVEVMLRSYNVSPTLRTYVFKNVENIFTKPLPDNPSMDYDVSRSAALNSVVDFGTCLLGNSMVITLIMQNEGNTGTFFIITESEWFNVKLEHISTNFNLLTENFTIYPAHFMVERSNFVEVKIEFFPTTTGLHVESFYLLCDNNTFEAIDFIGDAINFSPSIINIEMPNYFPIKRPFDHGAKHIYYCGIFLPYYPQVKSFDFTNTSCVDLFNRWETRPTRRKRDNKVFDIDPDWIEYDQYQKLLAYSDINLQFKINCATFQEGIYSIVLMMIIEDIPTVALEDNVIFSVFDNDEKKCKDHVDVLVAEVELQLYLESYKIDITPQQIECMEVLRYGELVEGTVTVSTSHKLWIACCFEVPDEWKSVISITHQPFNIHASSPYTCSVSITPNGYSDVDAKILLNVEDGNFTKILQVTAKVEKPSVVFTSNNLYFGIVPINSSHQRTLTIQSLSYETITWLIMEIYYSYDGKKFKEIECSNHLTQTEGVMTNYNETITIEYNVETKQSIHWVSFLLLISSHKSYTSMNSVCIVNCHIITPNVRIHTIGSEFPIECPNHLLHKNICCQRKILLQNYCIMPTSFIWGKPFGSQAEFMNIKFSPTTGIIQSKKGMFIDLYLTPLKLGLYEDIFIPCFIAHLEKPLTMRILCAVEDVYVNIYIPQRNGTDNIVFWPPKITENLDIEIPAYGFEEIGEEEQSVQLPINERTMEICECDICPPTNTPASLSTIILSYLNQFYKQNSNNEEECVSQTNLSVYTGLSESHCSYCPDNLRNYISSDLKYLEEVLEIFKVPLRQIVKKTIVIENLTPATATVNLSSSNFDCAEESKKQKMWNEVLCKINSKQLAPWTASMNEDGIIVKALPETKILKGFEKIEIDICVFATTWGVYLEEISIDINELLPFSFNVLVEVVGNPIEFPITRNSLLAEPILKFGTIPHNLGNVTRSLKFVNTCDVPMTIVWHTFLCEDPPEGKQFNVVFDLLETQDNPLSTITYNDSKVLITKEYYGKAISNIFQLHQTNSFIDKKSSGYVDITLNVEESLQLSHFDNKEIIAYLIGIIHLSEECKYQPELLRRPSLCDIEPAKIKLMASMEIPSLILLSPKDELNFDFNAYSICKANKLTLTKKLLFLNKICDLKTKIIVEEPFKIIQIKTIDVITNSASINISKNENLEITLTCTLDQKNILNISKNLFYGSVNTITSYEEEEEEKMKHNYVQSIKYLKFLPFEQFVKLTLTIYYPLFDIKPTCLDYGMVFINSSAKKLVTLSNKSAQELPIILCSKYGKEHIIICKPSKVTLKPFETVYIEIFFTPKEVKKYDDVISVLPYLPSCVKTISMQGTGTFNEKFFFKELI